MSRDDRVGGGRRARALGWLALALAGCDAGSSEPDPVVYFELDAPLGSSVIPVTFQVDGSGVGADTFRVHLPPEHIRSQAFVLDAGDHVLGAAVRGTHALLRVLHASA
ncbi:MAG: hypothetical protein SF070_13435 [Gemmatimonadota bacterium]|nr:hypothetical protein [Gemmatimonadota bacterium]